MKLIPWDIFIDEIEAYTVTKDFGDMSFNNPNYDKILNNRKNLAKYLNTSIDCMVAPNQVHSTTFKEVTILDAGKGMYQKIDSIDQCDALYTKESNLYLLSFHADCTPILLYARDKQIIASIHSGWVGTVNQIVDKVVSHLVTVEKCDPHAMYAYIGPSISKEKFEVQKDVIEKINAMNFDTSSFYEKTDDIHYLVDNKGLNKQQLLNNGILDKNITISPYCTIKNNDLFYSHRAKQSGRSITIIKKKAII